MFLAYLTSSVFLYRHTKRLTCFIPIYKTIELAYAAGKGIPTILGVLLSQIVLVIRAHQWAIGLFFNEITRIDSILSIILFSAYSVAHTYLWYHVFKKMELSNPESLAAITAFSLTSPLLFFVLLLEQSMNFSKEYVQKIGYVILIILLLAIPVTLSSYTRSQPGYLPQTIDFAKNGIESSIRQQATELVNKNFPFVSATEKEAYVQKRVLETINQNRSAYIEQVNAQAQFYKSKFQDENNQTYFVGLDPYFYLRFIENHLDHGYAGEYQINGTSYTNYINAPVPRIIESNNMMVQFSVYFHKFIQFFAPVKIETTFFYVPVILMALSIIPAFFLARRIAGDIAGFFAALVIAINPFLLARTVAGFSDTDAFNIFFPLLILWFIIEATMAKTIKIKSIFAILAGLSVGVFAFSWSGWWFIVTILLGGFGFAAMLSANQLYYSHNKKIGSTLFAISAVGVMATILTYSINKSLLAMVIILTVSALISIVSGLIITMKHKMYDIEKNSLLRIIIISVLFFLFATISVSFISNPLTVILSPFSAFGEAQTFKSASVVDLWPNVFTTVAELNPGSLQDIIRNGGDGTPSGISSFFFFVICLGLLLLPLRTFNGKLSSINYIESSILAVWIIGTIFMTLQGIRFVVLYIPAFALLAGTTIGLIIYWAKILAKKIEMSQYITQVALVVFFCLLFIPVFTNAYTMGKNVIPSADDDFIAAMNYIKQNSKEDAIISSWWDYGHQFITFAKRGASADGASQNGPQAQWLGQALVTNNPQEFYGISRMLNCESNAAYDKLKNELKSPYVTIQVLEEILLLDKEGAQAVLQTYNISEDNIANILKSSHCDYQVESFWIASTDMISKAGVWAHFGLWNFTKAQAWQLRNSDAEFLTFATQDMQLTQPEAQKLHFQLKSYSQEQANAWISPFPQYITSEPINCKKQENNITACPVGLQISQNAQIIQFQFDQNGENAVFVIREANRTIAQSPKKLTYVSGLSEEQATFQTVINETGLGIGVSILPDQTIILADPLLVDSMFNRMYFYHGIGSQKVLQYHQAFDSITGLTLKVFTRVINQTSQSPTPTVELVETNASEVPEIEFVLNTTANSSS